LILVAGGTGRLGKFIVSSLTEQGNAVRVFSRHSSRIDQQRELVENLAGDIRDPAAVERAVTGADIVISCVQGFSGAGGTSPKTVDWQGNLNLIKASRSARVRRFILVSVVGASPNNPIDLFQMKYRAEQELKESKNFSWTIIRSTAFMETWIELIAGSIVKTGKARILGSGKNPINFISAYDVARYVLRAMRDETMIGRTIEVGGPENLTLCQIAETFERVTGRVGSNTNVSVPMMRFLSVIMTLVKPALARQIRAAILMDTRDMRFDPKDAMLHYPEITLSSLVDVIKRDYGNAMIEIRR
jgi:uncharacterized protein YbjT (DUF2867 family)